MNNKYKFILRDSITAIMLILIIILVIFILLLFKYLPFILTVKLFT